MLQQILKEKEHLEDLVVDRSMILKWILNREGGFGLDFLPQRRAN